MRKIVFIVIAVVVAGLVGFFSWREFHVPGINYVTDFAESITENRLRIHRLYAAEIDLEAYEARLEAIVNLTEYTEEQMFQAAIASGRPVFFPSFNLEINRVATGEDEIWIDGFVSIELAETQEEERFRMGEISLEAVIAQGDLSIDRVEVTPFNESNDAPLPKIYTEQQVAVDISNAARFNIAMEGENGTVTLQFVYNIEVDTLMQRTVLEEQLLQLHAIITTNEYGILEIEFITESYSNLEELNA